MKLQLDVNHVGVMDTTYAGPDNTSYYRPYKFWANNDYDGATYPGSPYFDPGSDRKADPWHPEYYWDCRQLNPRSIRDLEDYARLWICGVPALTNAGYEVTLSWANVSSGDPAVNLLRAAETNGGTLYLTDTNILSLSGVPWQQIGSEFNWKYHVTTSNTLTLPISWFTNDADKYFLFEGAGIGSGELALTISQDGTNLAQTSAWLDLRDVKDLYERVVITNTVTGAISNWTSGIYSVQPASASALGDDEDIILFIHGFNNTEDNWLNTSDTTLKRLYWAGYHGQFASLRWPCDLLKLWTALSTDLMVFNRSEINAYKASSAMTAYLNQLRNQFPNHRLHLLAHSQGNAIASEAVSQGAPFDTYILTQAAMPASSYDANAPIHAGLSGTESIYGPTPEWAPMGYRGIYTNLTGRFVNYYNALDPVLDIWINDQGSAKPNIPSTNYRYDGTNGIYDPPFGSSYIVTDPQESLAYVSRSRTLPIGQSGPETPHGVITSAVDLNERFGFSDASSDDHSAEWAWPIQTTLPYFQQVLVEIQPPQ